MIDFTLTEILTGLDLSDDVQVSAESAAPVMELQIFQCAETRCGVEYWWYPNRLPGVCPNCKSQKPQWKRSFDLVATRTSEAEKPKR